MRIVLLDAFILAALFCTVSACGGPGPLKVVPANQCAGTCGQVITPTKVDISVNSVTVDPTYGSVLGYYLDGTSASAGQIVHLPANNYVIFQAQDVQHTASYLGPATASSAPWPSMCSTVATCVSTTGSPPNTFINDPNFTTGTINPGMVSNTYKTPGPGFWMIGCHFHYDSKGMRTVIVTM